MKLDGQSRDLLERTSSFSVWVVLPCVTGATKRQQDMGWYIDNQLFEFGVARIRSTRILLKISIMLGFLRSSFHGQIFVLEPKSYCSRP